PACEARSPAGTRRSPAARRASARATRRRRARAAARVAVLAAEAHVHVIAVAVLVAQERRLLRVVTRHPEVAGEFLRAELGPGERLEQPLQPTTDEDLLDLPGVDQRPDERPVLLDVEIALVGPLPVPPL